MARESAAWTPEKLALWRRLEAHPFENGEVGLDFTRRLARTLGWPLDAARAGIEEYRRFCFLAMVSPAPVTPSEEVDEIWHLHLTYTRDYWQRWCAEALGGPLHHDPTAGGDGEQRRFCRQYAETLALYESYFGVPRERFWPSLRNRFRRRARFRMRDTQRAFSLPHPSPRMVGRAWASICAAGMALLAATSASAAMLEVLDWKGADFLSFYIPLIVGVFALTVVLRLLIVSGGRAADGRGLSSVELAFVAGGSSRAADTYFMELAAHGAAQLTDSPVRLEVLDCGARLPREIRALGSIPRRSYKRSGFVAQFGKLPGVVRLADGLADRNLILSKSKRWWRDCSTSILIGPVLSLGLAKCALGLQRGRPVGELVTILVLAAAAFIVMISRGHQPTRAGKGVLVRLRQEYDRLIRAPRDIEVPLAFAFAGAAALAGTAYAPYAKLLANSRGDGGSGGNGGGGGDGGGCGGCGGS